MRLALGRLLRVVGRTALIFAIFGHESVVLLVVTNRKYGAPMARRLRLIHTRCVMKTKLIYPMVLVVFAGACGGRDGARSAAQKQYETVQEGSAAGVTSTIHGPGEMVPPITGTNADTTTAFTLDPNMVAAAPPPQQPAHPAGTLPPPMMSGSAAPIAQPQPQARPVQQQPRQPQPITQPQQQAEPQPEPQPQPQPTTDTATTTTTTTTPPPQPPPATTTTAEPAPAPPPPANDTSAEEQEEETEEEPPPPPPPGN